MKPSYVTYDQWLRVYEIIYPYMFYILKAKVLPIVLNTSYKSNTINIVYLASNTRFCMILLFIWAAILIISCIRRRMDNNKNRSNNIKSTTTVSFCDSCKNKNIQQVLKTVHI